MYQSVKYHCSLINKDNDCRESTRCNHVYQRGVSPVMLSLQVLLRATVFARMTPDQKTQLVKELQKLKWVQTEKGTGGGKAEGDQKGNTESSITGKANRHLHSSATAATAWACVGTGPMTVGPWEPPMSACLCLKPRLRSLHLSLPSLKTSAVCRCLSGT